MRLHTIILVSGLAAMAGCAPPVPVGGSPDMVQFLNGQLTVRYIDGVVCRAPVTGSGSGAFPDCPRATRYDVQMRHPNALGGTGLVEPFADIAITEPSGRISRFKTPAIRDMPLGPVRKGAFF